MPGKSNRNLEKRAKSPTKWPKKSKLVGTGKRRAGVVSPPVRVGLRARKFKRRNPNMRNLKRALSLAVASVMLLGMMVVGSGAASYDDVTSEHNQ